MSSAAEVPPRADTLRSDGFFREALALERVSFGLCHGLDRAGRPPRRHTLERA